MPRFVFDYVVDSESLVRLESTEEEDRAEVEGDLVLVGFSSNGYLHFWRRCQQAMREYERKHRSGGHAYAVITDRWADRHGHAGAPA